MDRRKQAAVIRDEVVERGGRTQAYRGSIAEVWHNFSKNKLALIGGVIVLIYATLAIFAPLLAPCDPVKQFDAPPGKHNPLPPLTRSQEGHLFLLGSDKFGRDILSRVLYGMRSLLEVSFFSVAVATLLGVLLGAVAGYKKASWVDELIMRIVDIMMSFPSLFLAVALLGAFGIGKTKLGPLVVSNVMKIMVVIAITFSPRIARVMRSAVLKEMAEEYVDAARMAGASGAEILIREVFINTIAPIVVQASLMMADAILLSSSVSFLGLGLQPPRPSLGLMLNEARDFVFVGAWWYSIIPGALIALAILGFNLMGDGLRDALDPRQVRKARR